MVESSLKNKLMSVFRLVSKYNGSSISQIKYQENLDEQHWNIVIKAVDDCLSFDDFQLLLNNISSSSSNLLSDSS